MRTFAFLALLLTAAFVLAQPAQAQPSPVVNRPLPPEILPDLARSLLDGTLYRSDVLDADRTAAPDTVQPWRYLPLAVGNAWEYESSFSYAPEWERLRIDITKDTLVEGRAYLIWESRLYLQGGILDEGYPRRFPVRCDTLSTMVFAWSRFSETESPLNWAPCPLDAAFDMEVPCFEVGRGGTFEVTGTYEGVLDFEPDTTVTGVAVKQYLLDAVYFDRFAAGFGKALYQEVESGGYHALRYARIDGETFGTEQFPVASESDPPNPTAGARVEVWPNPSRDRLTVAVTLDAPGEVTLDVMDVLGRVVERRDLGVLPAGRHTARIDGTALGAGVYLVRVAVAGTPTTVRRVTLLR